MTAIIDSFSGAVADLSNKDKRDPMKVLDCLSKHPRVSVWDMDDNKRYPLYKIIDDLKRRGLIVDKDEPYPWCYFVVTEAGLKELASVTNDTK